MAIIYNAVQEILFDDMSQVLDDNFDSIGPIGDEVAENYQEGPNWLESNCCVIPKGEEDFVDVRVRCERTGDTVVTTVTRLDSGVVLLIDRK